MGSAGGGVDRVEKEPEGGVRLRPVLGAETEQDHAAQTDAGVQHRAAAGDHAFALEPAAQQHVTRRITADDLENASGLLASSSSARIDPGQKKSFPPAVCVTSVTGRLSRLIARALDESSVISVPPASTNAFSAYAPSSPI